MQRVFLFIFFLSFCLAPQGIAAAALYPPVGFNEDWLTNKNAVSYSKTLGVTTNRMSVYWQYVEPTRHSYNWAPFDKVYGQMIAQGIRPIIVLQGAPGWATPGGSCTVSPICQPPPAKVHDQAWAKFVSLAAERYSEALAFEIWNEPNLKRFWAAKLSPARYVKLLRLASQEINKVNPQKPVLLGGLVPAKRRKPDIIPPEDYLRAVYRLGAAPVFDGLSVHPFSFREPWVGGMWKEINLIKRVRDSEDEKNTPLWLTEVTVTTSGLNGADPASQAEALRAIYASLVNKKYIKVFIIHRLMDTGSDSSSDIWDGSGVLNQDGSPKPAACTVYSLLVGGDCDAALQDKLRKALEAIREANKSLAS